MTKLSVNLNKIALLRNTRHLGVPSVAKFARIALDAGAAGITVHPRPDGRHVRAADVAELASLMRAYPHAEFNIEGNPFHNLMEFVREVRPHQCTLVPDESGQFTSDHGWSFPNDAPRLQPIVDELRALGVRASLFMDPTPAAMAAVKALGADRIELYTEPYAAFFGTDKHATTLASYVNTAKAAAECGLGVNAGHDLNLGNLAAFVAAIPNLLEVSIGHALIADAIEFGLAPTVEKYSAAISVGRAALQHQPPDQRLQQ
jgi:pyridoxine 5-phosphate synthase